MLTKILMQDKDVDSITYLDIHSKSMEDLTRICESLSEKQRIEIYLRVEEKIKPFEAITSKLLSMMPEHIRLAYSQKYENQVDTSDRLIFILSVLPEKHRDSLLRRLEKLLDTFCDKEKWFSGSEIYTKIVGLLPMPQRLDFAMRHKKITENIEIISSITQMLDQQSSSKLLALYTGVIFAHDVSRLVPRLPESERLACAMRGEYFDYYGDGSLGNVMGMLPVPDRSEFISSKISLIIEDSFSDVASLVPEESLLVFLQQIYRIHSWSTGNYYSDILADFLQSDHLQVKTSYSLFLLNDLKDEQASDCHSRASKLAHALWYLPEDQHLTLVLAHEQSVSNYHELLLIADTPLSEKDFLCLAMKHLDVVKSNDDVKNVTKHIPKDSRLTFMLGLIGRSRNDTQVKEKEDAKLSTYLELLDNANDKLTLVREYVKYGVRNYIELRITLRCLPQEERLPALNANLSSLDNQLMLEEMFVEITHLLQSHELNLFYRAYAAFCPEITKLSVIMSCIPASERLSVLKNSKVSFKFLKNPHDREITPEHFLRHLQPHEHDEFLLLIQSTDFNTLQSVVTHLQQSNRLDYILQHLKIIKAPHELIILSGLLDSNEHKRQLIQTVINSLPEQDKSHFEECLSEVNYHCERTSTQPISNHGMWRITDHIMLAKPADKLEIPSFSASKHK